MVATMSMMRFAPQAQQPVVQSSPATGSSLTIKGSNAQAGINNQALNDQTAAYQAQLDELAQMSSGGP